ncbi:metal ABC transporter permease [Actinomyces viscosus]|uniref:Manganese transport system membrane protein mntB n=1 Tax=Actinomyces viscosus TaxID=1656 RepID=A0A448PHG8_ACTVI|nr:metal ABC transporter permease [Actinomyces viscosus]TFH53628.1 metal ABC transporter permease [Actinomyces viscosus]VEI14333.1 Manganese transport system membrane protein mntB [Actinomyces viscosus]
MSIGLDILLLPIIEVVLMGLLAGLVGAIALVHRRIFFTESLTHATFPGAIVGVVVAAWISQALLGQRADFTLLSTLVLVGAGLMCLPMIWLMRRLSQIPGMTSQSAAGVVLTFGFALGYFLSKWFSPLPLKVDSFLAGSVLNVSRVDVIAVGVVLVLMVLVLLVAGRFLTFYSFDPLGYRASGLRPAWAEATVMLMITLTIVMLVPAVGTILPIALIAAPAAALAPWTSTMRRLLVAAPLLGAAIALAGLLVAVRLSLSAGGVIAVASGLVYLVSAVAHWAAMSRIRARIPVLR